MTLRQNGIRRFGSTVTPVVLLALAPGCPGPLAFDPGFALYVDQEYGNDDWGTGNKHSPFRTITQALKTVNGGGEIVVEPGIYGPHEVFPLMLPDHVTVMGGYPENPGPQSTALVIGAGSYASGTLLVPGPVAIVLGAGDVIQGLTLDADGGVSVWCERCGGSTIQESILTGSQYGIVVTDGATDGGLLSIIADVFEGNDVGLRLFHSTAVVRGSTFSSNGVGVIVGTGATADLGTATSPGWNTFARNSECGLENLSTSVVDAIGNDWGTNEYLFSATSRCASGVEIANPIGGAVSFQDLPPGDAPVFPGAAAIQTSAPPNRAVVSTPEPTLTWEPTHAASVMAVIARRPLFVSTSEIANQDDIVWAWNSGLASGLEGSVAFSDGAPVRDKVIQRGTKPSPLERGRTYYWAVWAWDETGVRIESASPLLYFIVAN